jgi:hypothetical protein
MVDLIAVNSWSVRGIGCDEDRVPSMCGSLTEKSMPSRSREVTINWIGLSQDTMPCSWDCWASGPTDLLHGSISP